MAEKDEATLGFYEREAARYAGRVRRPLTAQLDRFLDGLTPGARILELGCGGGQDAAYMLSRGFDILPTDGSPAMAAEAQRLLGREVAVMAFDQLETERAFDAIWASASLLHVPKHGLPAVLARIHHALHPGGRFWASYKTGVDTERDRFGRFYNNPEENTLRELYRDAGFAQLATRRVSADGYDGALVDWLWVEAERPPLTF